MKQQVRDGLRHPVVVVAVVGALAFAAGGCGSDGDGGGGHAKAGASSAAAKPADAFSPTTADEKAIVVVYGDYADAMASADPRGACAALTADAQEIVSGSRGCVKRMKELFALGQESQNKPYIVKLRVDGERARARVKTKLAKRTYPVSFAKRTDGEWKLDGSGARGDT